MRFVLSLLIINAILVSGCINSPAPRVIGRDADFFQSTTATVRELESAVVSRVVDGDTVELTTGEKVRLLGINSPEDGQRHCGEATDRLKELVLGKEVQLERDITDKDGHGRLLRYVFVNNENVNVKIVRDGLANVFIIEPDDRYEKELRMAESLAKNEGIGIWKRSADACADCIVVSYFHWNAKGDDRKNLNDEYVTIENECNFSCNLTNWSIGDEALHTYAFPEFVLGENENVTICTGSGDDGESKLYWKSKTPIWNNENGDALFLRDKNGDLVLYYHYEGY